MSKTRTRPPELRDILRLEDAPFGHLYEYALWMSYDGYSMAAPDFLSLIEADTREETSEDNVDEVLSHHGADNELLNDLFTILAYDDCKLCHENATLFMGAFEDYWHRMHIFPKAI